MKRIFFLAIAAGAFSLASCSKDDSYTPSKMPVQQFEEDQVDSNDVARPPKGQKEKPIRVQAP